MVSTLARASAKGAPPPLSPLLCALVTGLALRRIHRLLPNAMVKAFADDVALVVDNVGQALTVLQPIFEELGADSRACLGQTEMPTDSSLGGRYTCGQPSPCDEFRLWGRHGSGFSWCLLGSRDWS